MSFLNQLKSQASALQSEQEKRQTKDDEAIRRTEVAFKTVWFYLSDVVKQLNVIAPPGPKLSLDGRHHWPPLKLVDFRIDARKKKRFDQDLYDDIAVSWRIVPLHGQPIGAAVSANFPPDLQKIEARLAAGSVKHDRVNVRHPEKNTLQAIRFEHLTEARGGVTVTADHDAAQLVFRLACLQGFSIDNTTYPAHQMQSQWLDELAKMIVGQESRFV